MTSITELIIKESDPIVLLGELCDLCSGITKGRKIGTKETTEVPYMAVANVQDGSLSLRNVKTINATLDEIERYRLLPGDVLLTEGGDPDKLGRGSIWNGEIDICIHQNHIFRARQISEYIDMHYLAYLISSPYGKQYFLRQSKQTTGIASINMGQLKKFPVPLPPPEEQRRIATILDKAVQINQLDRQVKTKTKSLLRSIFIDHFGNPSTNKMRWETGSVRDLLKLVNGRAFKSSEWCTEGLPIIRIANVKRASEPYNYFNGAWDPSHLVQNGDILLCWAGQLVSIGVHKWERGEGLLNQHIFKVEPKIKFDPEFLTYSLGLVIERAKGNFRGIEMKHLTKSDLNREKLIIPPLEKQEKFGSIVRYIGNMEKENFEKSKKYQNLISSLQLQLFTNISNQLTKTKTVTND